MGGNARISFKHGKLEMHAKYPGYCRCKASCGECNPRELASYQAGENSLA